MDRVGNTQNSIISIRNQMSEKQSNQRLSQKYSSERTEGSCNASNSETTQSLSTDRDLDTTMRYSASITSLAIVEKQPLLSHSLLHQHEKHHQQIEIEALASRGTNIGVQMRKSEESVIDYQTDEVINASSTTISSSNRGMFFSSRCAEEDQEEGMRQYRKEKVYVNGQDNKRNSVLNEIDDSSLLSNFRKSYETEHKSSSHRPLNLVQAGRNMLSSSHTSNSNSSSHSRCKCQHTPRPETQFSANSSGSDDDGYNGSASSNDASGGSSATSCSSPSFCEGHRFDHIYNGQEHAKVASGDQVKHAPTHSHNSAHAHITVHANERGPFSQPKRTLKRTRNTSSSDIADFSSSSVCLQDYRDDDEPDSDKDVGYGAVVGTKTTGLSSDESEKNGEDYNNQRRLQKSRLRPKQQKPPRYQWRQQQQTMNTSVQKSKMRRGMRRNNKEDGNSSNCCLEHEAGFKNTLKHQEYQKPVFDQSYSLSHTINCNNSSNSTTLSHPTKIIQEQQHKELKATFQYALKQLDDTNDCSSCSIKPSSPDRASSYSMATIVPKVETSTYSDTEVQPSDSNRKCVSKMYSGSSTTTFCTQLPKTSTFVTSEPNLLYNFGADVMASIMSYMDAETAHTVLIMPLSKTWRSAYTLPQDVWKILCLSAPFYAKVDMISRKHDEVIDENWLDSHHFRNPVCSNLELQQLLGRYRLLHSSFVKCIQYLNRVKDDVSSRTPSGIEVTRRDTNIVDNDDNASSHPFQGNSSLKHFFAKANEMRQRDNDQKNSKEEDISTVKKKGRSYVGVEVVSRHDQAEKAKKKGKPGVKYGHSKLTQRLLGPVQPSGVNSSGVAGRVNLPWSCAIYSVVNWMIAFTDVAGIQNMCLKVLPNLLEDEKQRTSAQHAGLTDIVLRAMVLFPSISELHTAAFHTLVLLARPLGGKEGMLFHTSMVKSSGIFNVGSNTGKSGIAVMLDSMKRFSSDENLQAMGCWSMVNIALIPSQKVVLVKLGGISVAANAMIQHPHSAEVHFRALFALINLVIPSENLPERSAEAAAIREQVGGVSETSEKEMLDESVGQITNLVVVSMKNFWSSVAILNRACLVLHNLSLNESYHRILLWTPNCFQMLEWCVVNYRHDAVLQQSGRGTLQRLQMTLNNDTDLRQRFPELIRL